MLDLQSFNRALKAKWIQRYLDPYNRGKWKLFVELSLTGHDIDFLLQGNFNSNDATSLGIEEPFKSLSKRGYFWILKNNRPTLVKHQSGTTLFCSLTTSLINWFFTINATSCDSFLNLVPEPQRRLERLVESFKNSIYWSNLIPK